MLMPAAINFGIFCNKSLLAPLHALQQRFKSCQTSAGFFVLLRTMHSHCWDIVGRCGIMCLSKRQTRGDT